ncbi:MAG: BatD family protein [Opitutales bacterium]
MKLLNTVQQLITILVLTTLAPLSASAQNAIDPSQVQVQFAFNPSIVEPNQYTSLELSFAHEVRSGTNSINPPNRINIPQVAGLEMSAMNYSSRMERSFNGITGQRTVVTITYPFRVRAKEPGFYTISPFVVEYLGTTFNVAGASLEVIDTSNNAQAESVIMELIMPQDQVYVGETVKATIQVWVKEEYSNYQIQGINKLGTAFSEGTRARQEIRSRATRSGAIYNVNSWPITLTPIKGGEQTIQFEARARISQGQRSRSVFDLLNQRFGMNSPLNQSRMGTNRGRDVRDFMINSEPRLIPVKPLPLKSQPDIFSGAIGDFGLKVVPSTGSSMVGNPIRLTVDIIGQGNFNRIQAPPLDLGKDWKTFEPESEFQAGDALSYSGRKRFSYTLIPTHEDVQAIPAVKFAYFDPSSESYKTLETGAIPVDIEPNPDAEDFSQYFADLEEAQAQEEAEEDVLIMDLGRQASIPAPLAYAPAFQWSQFGVLLLTLSGFVLIKVRQNLARDEHRRRLQEAHANVQKFSDEGESAMDAGDARAFILATAGEVRAAVSSVFGPAAEAWTADEFKTQMEGKTQIEESLRNETCAFLRKSENALFRSDSNLGDFQYSEWKSESSSISSNWLKIAASSKKGAAG